jgi:aldehyde:ferredoxin oxidoreductase
LNVKGVFHRLLRINLTDQAYLYEDIPDDLLRRTLGGKGLGTALLEREIPPGADPLGPENRFILTVGPVTGTAVWGQSRFAAFAKSPASGGFAESYCGGTAAPRIKGCGVDAVILEGRSSSLTFVVVDERGVTFKGAAPYKGWTTDLAEEALLKVSPAGARGMAIGPAGERGVRFACVKSDRWRSLGRCGLGAVLGAKNVKGISFSGGRRGEIADPELMRRAVREISRKGKEHPVSALYRKYGTPMQVAATNAQNCVPTRYWTSGHFSKWENLSAEYMVANFDVRSHPCPDCFLQCTKLTRLRHGRHAGLEIEGPEYETIYALGGLNELDSLEEVAWLNDLCDKLGLDTMSAGNIAAFAVEARKRGRLDWDIKYNQPDRMAELFRMIASGEGVGAVLGRGILRAAAELGLEDLAVHVKGLEPAGFEPRALKGMALSYATAARGACHLRGTFYKAELSGLVAKEKIEGKAAHLVDYEDRAALFDCLVLCRFFRDIIEWEELGTIIAAATGLSFSRRELEDLANEITRRTRAFNAREGLGAEEDRLPERLLREKTAEGASLRPEELALMLREYNAIRSRSGSRLGSDQAN